jgi:hypothetical protein
MHLHLWLLSCVQSHLLLGWWPGPPQCLNTHFLQPDGRLDCSLHYLQSDDLSEGLIKCLLAPQTQLPSKASVPYAIVAFRLCLTYLLESPSFRVFFCVHHHPSLVPNDLIPCTVQEQHSGSSVCRQRPTSSGIHYCPGSVSSAVGGTLQLAAVPHIDPPVL